MPPSQRVREFPNEQLIVSPIGKLFCRACRETLCVKRSMMEFLPNWAAAAKKAVLVQPSSAASERVFSLLNNSFGTKQNSCLEDYVEASITLQYNRR